MKRTKVQVFTVAQISQGLGITQSIIESTLKRERIKPIMRIGNTRLFDEIAVERVRLVLSLPKSCPTEGENDDR